MFITEQDHAILSRFLNGAPMPSPLLGNVNMTDTDTTVISAPDGAFLQLYTDPVFEEVAYHVVSADRRCYRWKHARKAPSNILEHHALFPRNGQGNVKCHTFGVDSTMADHDLGFGGNHGHGSFGCPEGFKAVGKTCIAFPIQRENYFTEIASVCKFHHEDSVPYYPTDHVQNAVMRGALKLTVRL